MIDSLEVFYKVFKEDMQRELNGEVYDEHDREVLQKICSEINALAGTNIRFLFELDRLNVPGAGHIIVQYIEQIHSEWVKACILDPIVQDHVSGADKLILDLFVKLDRKNLSPFPVGSYVRYDNALKRLKPKRIKNELLELAKDPNFAIEMPFTMAMLASWKSPEMKEMLLSYLTGESVDLSKVKGCQGLKGPEREPELRRMLKFRALSGLKYYPSEDVYNAILPFANDEDADLRTLATKTINHLLKKGLAT